MKFAKIQHEFKKKTRSKFKHKSISINRQNSLNIFCCLDKIPLKIFPIPNQAFKKKKNT